MFRWVDKTLSLPKLPSLKPKSSDESSVFCRGSFGILSHWGFTPHQNKKPARSMALPSATAPLKNVKCAHKPGSVNVWCFLANRQWLWNVALPLDKFQPFLFLLKMSDCAVFDQPGLWLCKLQMFGSAVLFYSSRPSVDWLHDLSAKQQHQFIKLCHSGFKSDETQTCV